MYVTEANEVGVQCDNTLSTAWGAFDVSDADILRHCIFGSTMRKVRVRGSGMMRQMMNGLRYALA